MLPHASIASLMFMTSNAHLIAIPATTAMFHYLYRYNHIKKATLYFDMQKLGKNENYVATFEKIREILLTDERFQIYIEQRRFDEGGDDKHRNTTLIFENPVFQPFSYKVQGMTGKLDEERKRYSFECSFRDLVKESQGRINALIIFNSQNEAYFESLTVRMEQPRSVEFKITESTDDLNETEPQDLKQFNWPKRQGMEQQPKERPKSKYHQY